MPSNPDSEVYVVESHRIPLSVESGLPTEPEPVLVGVVQFIGGSSEWLDNSRKRTAAVDVLLRCSPLANHPALGHLTWRVRLKKEDEKSLESLKSSTFEDSEKGYRVWLPE
jgi:hypothetical protein